MISIFNTFPLESKEGKRGLRSLKGSIAFLLQPFLARERKLGNLGLA